VGLVAVPMRLYNSAYTINGVPSCGFPLKVSKFLWKIYMKDLKSA
jgi:hypothetical protein